MMLRTLLAAGFACLLSVTVVADPLPAPISPIVHLNASCTGFVIQPGMLVTAGHCISKLSGHHLALSNGEAVEGSLSMFSSPSFADDIAVIKFAPVGSQETLPLHCGPLPPVGTPIHMTGFPGSYGLATVWGRIAGDPRMFPSTWGRAKAAINISSFGGFSGSPVMNEAGKVVGILVGSMSDNRTLAVMVPAKRLCEFVGAEYV